MDNEEFIISAVAEPEKAASAERKEACGCPLANIPADVWTRFIKPPFRKRHPFIFWLLIVLAITAAFLLISLWDSGEDTVDKDNCIALVSINGPIMETASTLAWIGKIENSPGVKGVLLRVDSPGGGAAASQEIYAALARLGKKMPIAVSMGSMAASGGLMVSMAGHRIYANPSTVTGSIGVRMDIPQLQGLMGKIGVGQETLVTAPYKDAASYTHPLSPQDRAYLEKVLMNMHEQFVGIVAKGRNMSFEKAGELASGKIFTGEQALGLGLIDELGGQYEAHAWLAAKTGVRPGNKLLKKKAKNRSILESMLEARSIAEIVSALLGNMDTMTREASGPAFLYQF